MCVPMLLPGVPAVEELGGTAAASLHLIPLLASSIEIFMGAQFELQGVRQNRASVQHLDSCTLKAVLCMFW